jgi:hypothetical protein
MKYDKSTIYKLCCNDLNVKEIYIGSTTNFNRRKHAHKSDCNNENGPSYNLKLYNFIRSNGGFDNWSMVEIELFNARDKKNLLRRERYWIENEKASLNSRKSYITEEEVKKYHVEYRENNIEKLKQNRAEYYVKNVEEIQKNVAEYQAKNIEDIKQYKAEYYVKNVEKIKQNRAEYFVKKAEEKITCCCGSIIIKLNISNHLKTQKHKNFLIKV